MKNVMQKIRKVLKETYLSVIFCTPVILIALSLYAVYKRNEEAGFYLMLSGLITALVVGRFFKDEQ